MYRELHDLYPYAHCELDFRSPWELLVATVLSAQTTDVRVNLTTPALFARFPGPAEIAAGDRAEIERLIQPTGFFRAKTKSVMGPSFPRLLGLPDPGFRSVAGSFPRPRVGERFQLPRSQRD